MDKRAQLKYIVKHCEKQFGRGKSDGWKHGDYNDFSEEILKKTKVAISPNTLKRIFGKIAVDGFYQPQQATIDALKEYCTYSLKDKEEDSAEQIIENETITPKPKLFKKYGVFVAIFILLASIGFIVLNRNNTISGSIKLISMEGTLPKTCLFGVQTTSSKDSVFIDFGDKSPLVYATPEQNKVSHIYLFPGVFDATLTNRNRDIIVAKTKVYVASNKWLGLGFNYQWDIPNHYYEFPAVKDPKNNLFHITNYQLHQQGIDTLTRYHTRLCNYTPIRHTADNFIFETTFKKEAEKTGIYCQSVQFQVICLENRIRFNFRSSGCSSKVLNIISEKRYEGTNSDLSKFVLNLNQWNTVKLLNKNKHVTLFVNGKLIFKETYSKSLGGLRGVFVEFERSGYFKNCSLKTFDGKILYNF